ncbi:MAG: type secretion system protein VirB5, partial [Blastocatellia bacterium]|nr:type secretion system protein VirB5 [Blastocatellia bacterium]
AADLQNRMSAELGMAQSAQTKLQAINANLTANQLNDSNQAAAVRAKFFQTPSQ